MRPQLKRFIGRYGHIADAIASVDIGQEDRERVAGAVADAINGKNDPDFLGDTFKLLASDPLVPCAGGCGKRIRVPMHDSRAPDGRSIAWREHMPQMSCVTCGPIRRDSA